MPSELEAAVKEALVKAFVGKVPLDGTLIANQLDTMKPLSVAFADRFNAMREWAENNARPASRAPAAVQEGGIAEVVQIGRKPVLQLAD